MSLSIAQRSPHSERCTVILTPYDGYAAFSRAVDELYARADHPFDLIIIECAAPASVQAALEARKKRYRNVKLLYTREALTQPAARNLALAHVRTPRALFLDADVRPGEGWLSGALADARRIGADLLFPPVAPLPQDRPGALERASRRRHALLCSMRALEALHGFDEDLDAAVAVADLVRRAEAAGLAVADGPSPARFHRERPVALKRSDLPLYVKQWDAARAARSVASFAERWPGPLDAARFLRERERAARDRRELRTPVPLPTVGSLVAPMRRARTFFARTVDLFARV